MTRLQSLPPEQQREVLRSLAPEQQREILRGLAPEHQRKVLRGLTPEQRLAGLSAEEIVAYLKKLQSERPSRKPKPRRRS